MPIDSTVERSPRERITDDMETYIYQTSNSIHVFISRFLAEYINSIRELGKLGTSASSIDVQNCLTNSVNLRDEYISFFEILVESKIDFDIEDFGKLLVKLYNMTLSSSSSDKSTEHYKFITQELFLYTIAILLENEDFGNVYYLLNKKYIVKQSFSADLDVVDFSKFQFEISSMDNSKYTDPVIPSQLFLINRSSIDGKDYTSILMETDILLTYLSFNDEKKYDYTPRLINHIENIKVEVIQKMISKLFFEKVKILFDVNDKTQMINYLNERMGGAFDSYHIITLSPMIYHIDNEKLCKFD